MKSYIDRVDVAVTSLGNDVLAATAAGKVMSARFLEDWNAYGIEWRVYYEKNRGFLSGLFGGTEIQSEVENYEKRLEGFRQRYADETKLSPTMKPAELPAPPAPSGVSGSLNPSQLTGPLTALAVLAGIVILGPALSRRM